MAYARQGPDSDVYVFATDAGYECCGCPMQGEPMIAEFATAEELITHLERHMSRGDKVPPDCIPTIRADLDLP